MAQTPIERALDRGLRLPKGRMRIFRRASVRSIRNAAAGSGRADSSSAAKDLGALVIYPTHVMPVRRAQKQNWNNRMQARLCSVETTNEQSISFFFEQLDIPVVAPGEPVNGIGVAQDMRAKAGEAISKVTDAAQQAGSQAKDAAASLASDASQKAKGF